MSKITLLVTLFAVVFTGACSTPLVGNANPQLSICEVEDRSDLDIRVTMGSGKLRILKVDYQTDAVFNTDIRHDIHRDDIVPVPFCNQQGIGDVSFLVEVTPSGEGLLYGYEYSAEMYFEVSFPNADIEIYDADGFGNYGYSYAGIAVHTDGEPHRFTVEIQRTQM